MFQIEDRYLDSINLIIFADYLGYKSDLLNYAELCFYNKQNLNKVQEVIFALEASIMLHYLIRDYGIDELKNQMNDYYDMMVDYYNGGGTEVGSDITFQQMDNKDDLPF